MDDCILYRNIEHRLLYLSFKQGISSKINISLLSEPLDVAWGDELGVDDFDESRVS